MEEVKKYLEQEKPTFQEGFHLLQVLLDTGGLAGAVVAEQLVHGDAEVVGNGGEVVHVGVADARLPAGHGLGGNAQVVGQLVLGDVVLFAQKADLFSDADLGFHGRYPRFRFV